MKITLPYGSTSLQAEVPDNADIILPERPETRSLEPGEMLYRALASPISGKPLCELVAPGERVAVLVSDATRPAPTHTLLSYLLPELEEAEAKPLIVFALGLHRGMSLSEKKQILGQHLHHVRHREHDTDNCVHLGHTSRGTPVEVFSPVAECEHVLCTGNIEYHYYAGYTGGAKALLPGVSSKESIVRNHSLMLEEGAVAGNRESPVRCDIEEAARIAGVDFILNVVLDADKNIVHAVAGDPIEAHRAGCTVVDALYRVQVEPADIVVVSAGGAPKDINLFQAHKALEQVRRAVKPGGAVILVAACSEEYGNSTFEEWLRECPAPRDAIARFEEGFVMGGHKAALLAKLSLEQELYLVSEHGRDFAEKAYFNHASTLQQALKEACKKRRSPEVLIVPQGNTTLLSSK